MIKKTVKIPIYFGNLIMIYSEDIDLLNKKYNQNIVKGYDAVVFKTTAKCGFDEYVVVFLNNKITGAVIAHECVHLVNHIYIYRMMSLDQYNDEPQAYLTGWFFDQCEKFVSVIKNIKLS